MSTVSTWTRITRTRAVAFAAVAAATLAFALTAQAEPKDKANVYEQMIGSAAPGFTLTDVSTGKEHSLSDFQGKIVVVRFQSESCPWDKMREDGGYERVLNPMAQAYADKGVVFLAINSNKSESVESLKAYHAKHSLAYPILKDPGNEVADAYHARTTPHVYVVDAKGVLRYAGGIEEVPGSPDQCGEMGTQYLAPVLDALIAGTEPPFTVTQSKGCSIKRVAKAS